MRRACKVIRFAPARQRGITIIEIMVTLAIAAVLIGLAVPAFNGFVAQRALTAQVNDFLVAVQYARSEAGRRGTYVSVQALNAANAANEWGPGWCVVVGNAPVACPNDGTQLRDFTGARHQHARRQPARSMALPRCRSTHAACCLPPAAAGTFNLCNPRRTRWPSRFRSARSDAFRRANLL